VCARLRESRFSAPISNAIERISLELEGMLREVRGVRSTFAERQTGREYIDIAPNREAIAALWIERT
jgi:Cu/Ag efflux pump CusA